MGNVRYRHNVMNINSIETFMNIKGGLANDIRDVYFIRMLGENATLISTIDEVDTRMNEKMHQGALKYIRINELPKLANSVDVEFYSSVYEAAGNNGRINFKNINANDNLQTVIKNAYTQVVDEYAKDKNNVSESMKKNLVVKILFWLDSIAKDILKEWDERKCIKVVADNIEKEQEYLFYLFLTFIGCDVLLIENRKDVNVNDKIKVYTKELRIGDFGNAYLSKYEYKPPMARTNQGIQNNLNQGNMNQSNATRSANGQNNRVVIPEHPRRNNVVASSNNRTEKSFEELAQLASSIVLIAVHDENGDVMGTGSGIMIGRNGYILTNNHVIAGGRFYSVRIENDDEVYKTDEVIKYNSLLDLAVIRINKVLNPIPIYRGEKKLVRGQKVVAIGSPLGLFNSISDGIISGFRYMDDVDMIQFTAPTSHGSSGGAVLNMYGEVIGISTAGMDRGQNINLAVGYENILMFSEGFMRG